METTADKKVKEARENIDSAIKNLMEALDKDTYGSDQFNDGFQNKLEKTWISLRSISRDLR